MTHERVALRMYKAKGHGASKRTCATVLAAAVHLGERANANSRADIDVACNSSCTRTSGGGDGGVAVVAVVGGGEYCE